MRFFSVRLSSAILAIVLFNAATGGFCAIAEDLPGTNGIFISQALNNGKSVVNVIEKTDATDGGVAKILDGMDGINDVSFYKRPGRNGLFASGDVIIIKINAQWSERGSTNNDLLKGLIQYIVNHPNGFTGEIIVADNGQGNMGSASHQAKLDWVLPNSKDKQTNAMAVIDSFAKQGHKVSGIVWDDLTGKYVVDFDANDNASGFVVEQGATSTGIRISYPKFTTKYRTALSFKKGIWNAATKSFDSQRLKVINMPILKSDMLNQIDGVLGSYQGTASNVLTAMSALQSIRNGGMGTQLLATRFPTLNILDMIYLPSRSGSASPYQDAIQTNIIAVSTDPVALDWWAAKNVMLPIVERVAARDGGKQARERVLNTNPDNKAAGFGAWLAKSCAELNKAGIPSAMSAASIMVKHIAN
jgi:uncharacterized protein (DUF362 family)